LGNAAALESRAWVSQFNVKTRADRAAYAVAPRIAPSPSPTPSLSLSLSLSLSPLRSARARASVTHAARMPYERIVRPFIEHRNVARRGEASNAKAAVIDLDLDVARSQPSPFQDRVSLNLDRESTRGCGRFSLSRNCLERSQWTHLDTRRVDTERGIVIRTNVAIYSRGGARSLFFPFFLFSPRRCTRP